MRDGDGILADAVRRYERVSIQVQQLVGQVRDHCTMIRSTSCV